jgi:predicted Zn-dependent protease
VALSLQDQKHLLYAQGYLDLGMFDDAHREIDQVILQGRVEPSILGLRLAIYLEAEQWHTAIQLAESLLMLQPNNPTWSIQLAYATRRGHCLEAAQRVLQEAEKRFPKEPLIKFNLGCYAAQLGEVKEAKVLVERAIKIDRTFREIARHDPDLAPIRSILFPKARSFQS